MKTIDACEAAYKNGYTAGYEAAESKIVHCKDCKDYSAVMFMNEPMHFGYCCNLHDVISGLRHRYEGDFCSYGVPKK